MEGDVMMKRNWRNGLVAIGALIFAPFAANALPVVYTISDHGLDGARICTTATCASIKFDYAAPAAPPNAFDPASGTITLDTGTVAFSISVASGTFLAVGDVPDNGVDEIEFTSLLYSGTLTGATFVPSGLNTLISWAAQQPAGITVSGNYEQRLDGGNVNGPDAFAVNARVSAGSCLLTASNHLTCGFTMGPGGTPTPFQINVGPDATPVLRRVIQTLNVEAVPEPGTVLLVGLGVVGIALRGRPR